MPSPLRWNKAAVAVLWVLIAVVCGISCSCSWIESYTVVEIPANLFNPSLPEGGTPVRYYSEKNMYVRVRATTDTLELVVIGDSSTVNRANGDVAVATISTTGGTISSAAGTAIGAALK